MSSLKGNLISDWDLGTIKSCVLFGVNWVCWLFPLAAVLHNSEYMDTLANLQMCQTLESDIGNLKRHSSEGDLRHLGHNQISNKELLSYIFAFYHQQNLWEGNRSMTNRAPHQSPSSDSSAIWVSEKLLSSWSAPFNDPYIKCCPRQRSRNQHIGSKYQWGIKLCMASHPGWDSACSRCGCCFMTLFKDSIRGGHLRVVYNGKQSALQEIDADANQ